MPACTAARNMYSLPKKPDSGGMPAMLNMNTAIASASAGIGARQAAEVGDLLQRAGRGAASR